MSLFAIERFIVVEEKDLAKVIEVCNRHRTSTRYYIGECEKKTGKAKWVLEFFATNREWKLITKDLVSIGTLSIRMSPNGTTNLYFDRA